MTPIKWDGKPITKPGLYSGIPLSAYHSGRLCAGPSISHSGLHRILFRSLAHFYDQWPVNPDCAPQDDTEAEGLLLGRAAHHLLLGEPRFQSEYVVRPAKVDGEAWHGNKTVCKEWLKVAKANGLTVITADQLERVKGIALSLSRQALVQQGALNGLIETTMCWIESGIYLLSRPDVFPTASGDVVDLKTARDVTHRALVRAVANGSYHVQGALARSGYKAITGDDLQSFSLYFVESDRPHCCALYRITDRDLDLGERLYKNGIAQFLTAFNTGVWPGPGGPQTVERYLSLSDAERDAEERALVRSEP